MYVSGGFKWEGRRVIPLRPKMLLVILENFAKSYVGAPGALAPSTTGNPGSCPVFVSR